MNPATSKVDSSATQPSNSNTHLHKAESSGFATGLPGGGTTSSSNNSALSSNGHSATGLSHSTSTGTGHSASNGTSNGTGLGHSSHAAAGTGLHDSARGVPHNYPSTTSGTHGSVDATNPSSRHDHSLATGHGSPAAGHSTHPHSSSAHPGNSSTPASTTNGTNAPRHPGTGAGFSHDATGHHPGVGDKFIGTAEKLAGKVTNDSRKVIEGQTRKEEGKEGLQAAKAEGAL
ncbi:hypothetical protein JCM11491_001297 [Sporobolomyces phaffii]